MTQTLETDQARWVLLWNLVGAKGDPLPPYKDLRIRYSKPQRKYHVWQHITDGLAEFEPSQSLALHPEEIKLAYYFHDAIYDTRTKDSENVDNSALLAVDVLQQAKLPPVMIQRVADLVLVTKHTTPSVGVDAQLIVDIDFSVLGKPEAEFDEYERNIRQEYAWVEDQIFRSTRADILTRFLQRPQIFNTQFFVNKYEEQARKNLQRSISNLRPSPNLFLYQKPLIDQ